MRGALNWLEGEEEGGSPVGGGDDRAREEEHGAVARRWGTMGTTQTRGHRGCRVGRGVARGHPGACRGRSGADSAGGGPLAWRHSCGK
jgi:hypothetical protein